MTSAGSPTRRGFLKYAGTLVAVVPLVPLAGCADGSEAPAGAPPDTSRSTRSVAPDGVPSSLPPPTRAQAGTPPPLEESDAMAQALGYRHVAADVDTIRFPRFQPGHVCANCSLYQTAATREGWGGCAIFPGRLVDARGWCNAYVPVA